MWYLVYLYIFITSLLLSIFLTKISCNIAPKLGFIDQPSERKFHTEPVPLMGGIAIALSFFTIILLNLFVIKIWPQIVPGEIKAFLPGIGLRLGWLTAVLLGGIMIAAIGLIDDKKDLAPFWKLLVQFIAAVLIASVGIRIKIFITNESISFIMTILWIMIITNAFNLLDNMDGISAGISVISSLILFIVAIILNGYFIATLLSVFMGSVLGFLFFNFPKAKLFMGDCGSMFVGFIISVVTILGTYYGPNTPTLFPVVIPLLVLAVPLFDTISVVCIRLYKKQPIFKPDRNHFSHRLVNRGMSVRTTVLFIYLVTFCVGLPCVLLPFLPLIGVLVVFMQTIGIISIIAMLEYYHTGKTIN